MVRIAEAAWLPDDARILHALPDTGGTAGLERRPAAYRSSAHLEEIDVHGVDGSVTPLILKAASTTDPGAGSVRPRFLQSPVREALVYRHVVATRAAGAPRMHDAEVDRKGAWGWILLERVQGRVLWQCGESELWCEAARWLARHHARHRAGPGAHLSGRLLAMDRSHHGRWLHRARRILEEAGDARGRDALARLTPRFGALLDRIERAPVTVLHGEFFPSNILIREVPRNGGRVSVIDWEGAGVGACVLDVAALTSGRWPESDRLRIEESYRDALLESGWWTPDADEFHELVSAARVQRALVQLGWCAGWSPPAEHEHDWIAEIERYLEADA